ncbi:fatty acid synthase-like [Ixodes scapularis]
MSQTPEQNTMADEDVVITGFSAYFPQANHLAEFRKKLYDGVDMVTDDEARWPRGLLGLPERCGKIRDLSQFDAQFFGVQTKQAHVMDPQLRMLLETSYEAIVDAGYDPGTLRGRKIGVFMGCSDSETYEAFIEDTDKIDGHALVGCSRAMFSNRVSYCLDFNGKGYVRSEAVGMFFLQRVSEARRIYAKLVHLKANADGFKPEGVTFPSARAQEALMRDVYEEARVDPRSVSYVEAHGTGTKVGDPQELSAISNVYCREGRKEPLLIGSAKSNMGHSEAASTTEAAVLESTQAARILAKHWLMAGNGLLASGGRVAIHRPTVHRWLTAVANGQRKASHQPMAGHCLATG